MKMRLFACAAASVATAAVVTAALPVGAQGYKPVKPVEFMTHTGPGGGSRPFPGRTQ